jgi:protein-disulfide isomerase
MTLSISVGGDDHSQGPATAPVTLLEYGDYECPYCGAAYPVAKAVVKHFGSRLRFVFRNMPLSQMHPYAELAAEAAEAAAAQGKFWEMHDALYEHQAELGPKLVQTLAQRLKLDLKQFDDDLASHRFRDHVKRDFMGGVRSGVAGTPTFFINGERYDGELDQNSLTEAVQRQFGRAGKAPA